MRSRLLSGTLVLALASWLSVSAGAQDAQAADLDDFALKTGRDLLDLCEVDEADPLYVEATMFCLGVVEGMMQYHDAIGRGPDGQLVVCPEGDLVPRGETVEIFVAWGEANPDRAASLWPAEAVVLAALDAWGPCDR